MYKAFLTQRISVKLDIGDLYEHLLIKSKLVKVIQNYRTLRENLTTCYCCRDIKSVQEH